MLHKLLIRSVLMVALYWFASLGLAAPYTIQTVPLNIGRSAAAGSNWVWYKYIRLDRYLNDKGQVVGVDDAGRIAIWSNGILTDIGIPPYVAMPVAISASGQVAIDSEYGCSIWSQGKFIGLGGLGSKSGDCQITGMNAAGQAIGLATVFDSNGINRGIGAFLWSNGTMINLDPYDNGRYADDSYPSYACKSVTIDHGCPLSVNSWAIDINDNGQVLVLSKHDPFGPADFPTDAYVWSNGVLTPYDLSTNTGEWSHLVHSFRAGDMSTALNQNDWPSGITYDPSWQLRETFAINKSGQILAWGFSDISTHQSSFVLLTPQTPTPSCDANQDGKVNTTDLSVMYAANNTPNPTYDLDGDGKVTVRDIRICVLQCNNANCQP